MNYPCSKFGDCSFSRFGFIMRTNTERERKRDAAKRFTPATDMTSDSSLATTDQCGAWLLTHSDDSKAFIRVCLFVC